MVGITGALFLIGMVILVIEARRVDFRPLDQPVHLWVPVLAPAYYMVVLAACLTALAPGD